MKKLPLLFTLTILYLSAFSQAPTITSFSPASGPVGTLVTITGTNLSNPTVFTIGAVSAIVLSDFDTVLIGMVMPGAATGTVSVATAGGTDTGSGHFTITATSFPHVQQGPKLVGTGAVGSAQGYSVALSADGNTAIVGGPSYRNDTGAAWIFIRIGSTWVQQGAKLFGSGAIWAARQGNSVALSADGNTALVGGQSDSSTGAIWVFIRNDTTWSQQGPKLVGTGYVTLGAGVAQGVSVAISADGNTALVGGPGDNFDTGAVWIYTRSGSTWTQQGSKLVGTGGINNGSSGIYQGWSVALSADGNTAILGGLYDNFYKGAAWIFTRSGSTWAQQGSKLVGTGAVGWVDQGISVALSADGNTAMVGGNGDNSATGAVWIYTRSGNTWTQQGPKLTGTGAAGDAEQGWSVALSADGNTAIVGGLFDNLNIGAAWIYTRSGSTWTQQGSKLLGTGVVGFAEQGQSVALSADGNTAIVGGLDDNSYIGAAWVFASGSCPPLSSSMARSICQGSTFNFNGQNLSASGTFIDTLTAVYGCDSVVTLNLTVSKKSASRISKSICPGNAYNFNGQSLSAAGTYYDTLTVVTGCDSIITLSLSLYPSPTVTWGQTDTIVCEPPGALPYIQLTSDTPLGGVFSGVDVSGDSLYPTALGVYSVTYTFTDDAFGCSTSLTKRFDFEICEGISGVNQGQNIHLYPNPNKGSFTLQTSNSINRDYTISDMLGHVIAQRSIRSDSEMIDLPFVSQGVYTLVVKGASPLRFVIVR